MPTATGMFRRLSFVTLVAVYFLVFIGGLVRSTGSGMGCPDWPKCFGRFVPPVQVSELPSDYKEFYSEYRNKKNKRFASFLKKIGMQETAEALLNDPSVREEADFNAVKTWIEYINRLVGAIVGLLLTILFILSLKQPWVFRWYAGLAWFLVLVTGWFGSIVVSTNLTPWTVTIHLGLAMAIVVCLVLVWQRALGTSPGLHSSVVGWGLIVGLVLLVVQIYLGTRVRSSVDLAAASGLDRGSWITSSGAVVLVHRTFSWSLVIWVVFLSWRVTKKEGGNFPVQLFGLVLALISTGAVLAYLGLPKLIQPLHLLLACLLTGQIVAMLFRSQLKTKHG